MRPDHLLRDPQKAYTMPPKPRIKSPLANRRPLKIADLSGRLFPLDVDISPCRDPSAATVYHLGPLMTDVRNVESMGTAFLIHCANGSSYRLPLLRPGRIMTWRIMNNVLTLTVQWSDTA